MVISVDSPFLTIILPFLEMLDKTPPSEASHERGDVTVHRTSIGVHPVPVSYFMVPDTRTWSRVAHAPIVIGRHLTPRGTRVRNHRNMTSNTSSFSLSLWVRTPAESGYLVHPMVIRLPPPTRNGPLLPILSKQIKLFSYHRKRALPEHFSVATIVDI